MRSSLFTHSCSEEQSFPSTASSGISHSRSFPHRRLGQLFLNYLLITMLGFSLFPKWAVFTEDSSTLVGWHIGTFFWVQQVKSVWLRPSCCLHLGDGSFGVMAQPRELAHRQMGQAWVLLYPTPQAPALYPPSKEQISKHKYISCLIALNSIIKKPISHPGHWCSLGPPLHADILSF